MNVGTQTRGALRLMPCSYGLSKLSFRGPLRPIEGRFVAFLGGSETFAKYIAAPFPALVEAELNEVCINLGCQSAGPDAFVHDTAVQSLCHDATATVIQVMGAANLSNAFYKVHPRRNDRFIAPTAKLIALYPEVDFVEIAFTGHLIERLRDIDEDRFALVEAHLQRTWVRRMRRLIGQCHGPVTLLWIEGADMPFVTRDMLDPLLPVVAGIVTVQAEAGPLDGMCYAPMEAVAAQAALGCASHERIATEIVAALEHHCN